MAKRKEPTGKKHEAKRGRGRPRLANPNTTYVPMKVSPATKTAAEQYGKAREIEGLSTAIREAAEAELRRAGYLS